MEKTKPSCLQKYIKNAYTGWAAKPLHKAYLKKDFSHTFRFTSTLPATVFRHTVYLEFMYLW